MRRSNSHATVDLYTLSPPSFTPNVRLAKQKNKEQETGEFIGICIVMGLVIVLALVAIWH